jgi:hypothetical protein
MISLFFTKTGSGQTQGKYTQKRRVSAEEGNDAPLVLLDGSAAAAAGAAEVLILSAFDKFGHQRSQVIDGDAVGWGPDMSLAPVAKALPKGYNSSAALFGGVGGECPWNTLSVLMPSPYPLRKRSVYQDRLVREIHNENVCLNN